MEVLIAAAFLIIVFSGIARLFASCMFSNEANRNSTVAITHAQYVMEEIRSTTFTSIENEIDVNFRWDLDTDDLKAVPYNLTTLNNEEVDVSVTTVGNILEVTVDMSWKNRRGEDRDEQLVTRIADYQ